tara:strand:- start:3742 stop:4866 length:1125 start_codon:yes stop_codon:yes gene_type:complete
MTIAINWKTGFEIELAAPRNLTREDLAQDLAQKNGGTVDRFFHPQSEPSKHPDRPTFENLTHGFRLMDAEGEWIASFVDDLTLQADFTKQIKSLPGWCRIVSDDRRLLRLAMLQCDPNDSPQDVLKPLASLFGTEIDHHGMDMFRVSDDRGQSIAICAPLPGERERPCEIITAPIISDHHRRLSDLLDNAKNLGFLIPREGATHIHFDAAPLCSALTIARLVRLLANFGDDLKQLVGSNPNCVRLGGWPKELQELTDSPEFLAMAWPEAQSALSAVKLSKYCDFNLLNIANDDEKKHTFELRILPATMNVDEILHAAALFEGLLEFCCAPTVLDDILLGDFAALLISIPMPPNCVKYWQGKLQEQNKLAISPSV